MRKHQMADAIHHQHILVCMQCIVCTGSLATSFTDLFLDCSNDGFEILLIKGLHEQQHSPKHGVTLWCVCLCVCVL